MGLLSIRAHTGDRERCIAEADHLHNIPTLLQNTEKNELHHYYWNVERPSFIRQSKPDWLNGFQQLWIELEAANKQESNG
jgi:hypothetical protein